MLQEFFNANLDFSVTVKKSDLIEIFEEIANRQKAVEPKEETYLTPKEACDMLGIDRSSLWRWNRNGYIDQIKVGGKSRYRMSDVRKIQEGGGK